MSFFKVLLFLEGIGGLLPLGGRGKKGKYSCEDERIRFVKRAIWPLFMLKRDDRSAIVRDWSWGRVFPEDSSLSAYCIRARS